MADLPSTYSPDEVMISFCGQDITGGMGDGDFISVEPAAEEYTTKTGADGSKARAKNLDRGAVAKITTLATGTANAILHALLAADAAGPWSFSLRASCETISSAAEAMRSAEETHVPPNLWTCF